jgi:hypothetical protein
MPFRLGNLDRAHSLETETNTRSLRLITAARAGGKNGSDICFQTAQTLPDGLFVFQKLQQIVDQKRRPDEPLEEGPDALLRCFGALAVKDPRADHPYAIDGVCTAARANHDWFLLFLCGHFSSIFHGERLIMGNANLVERELAGWARLRRADTIIVTRNPENVSQIRGA